MSYKIGDVMYHIRTEEKIKICSFTPGGGGYWSEVYYGEDMKKIKIVYLSEYYHKIH